LRAARRRFGLLRRLRRAAEQLVERRNDPAEDVQDALISGFAGWHECGVGVGGQRSPRRVRKLVHGSWSCRAR
jgi:hypothetical protein